MFVIEGMLPMVDCHRAAAYVAARGFRRICCGLPRFNILRSQPDSVPFHRQYASHKKLFPG
jgi:hypothetical protein